VAVVHCLDDRCGGDHAAGKEATVEALDCLLTALDAAEFEVDFRGVWVCINVNDFAELARAFCLDLLKQLGLPDWSKARFLSVTILT
jgi:hypothetical protein